MKVIEARGMELLRCLVHRIGRSLTRIADPPMMLSCFWATIFPLSFDEPLHTLTPIGIIPCGHRKRAQIRGRRGPYDGAKKLALGSHASSAPSYTRSRACAITGQEAGVKQAASGYSETFLPSST